MIMQDEKKLRISLFLVMLIIVLSITYTVFQDYFASEVFGYISRRSYYHSAISPKGLSLHEGQYWRKSQ